MSTTDTPVISSIANLLARTPNPAQQQPVPVDVFRDLLISIPTVAGAYANITDPQFAGGAKGGAADDTAAYTATDLAATAAGVPVNLPSGTYSVTAFPASPSPAIGRGRVQSATFRLVGLFAGLTIALSNWTAGAGGSNLLHNPDSNFFTGNVNSSVILGGRGPSYTNRIVQAGANVVELAGITSGGDNYIEVLAGWIGGGAHHIAGLNDTGAGSHIAIGGGSTNTARADYAGIFCGTLNLCYGLKAVIVGGDSNRIGVTSDQTAARNSFIGGGYLNTIDGPYAWIPGGQENKAPKSYAGAMGFGAVADTYGEVAQASGYFSFAGDAQTSVMTLRRTTTTGVATQLLPDNATAIIVGTNSTWLISAYVVADRTDVVGSQAGYVVQSVVSNRSGTLTILAQTTTIVYETVAAWNADIQVSGSNVMVRGTGVAGSTINWLARVEVVRLRS